MSPDFGSKSALVENPCLTIMHRASKDEVRTSRPLQMNELSETTMKPKRLILNENKTTRKKGGRARKGDKRKELFNKTLPKKITSGPVHGIMGRAVLPTSNSSASCCTSNLAPCTWASSGG